MSRMRTLTTAVALLFLAAPLAAQAVSGGSTTQPAVQAAAPAVVNSAAIEHSQSLAPTQSAATVGVHAFAPAGAPVPAPAPRAVGQNPAMMIVGGVALLVGAVVGGDSGTILMVGGGVLGLLGLWNYLR